MLHAAIVCDGNEMMDELCKNFDSYNENSEKVKYDRYDDYVVFLTKYKPIYDIVIVEAMRSESISRGLDVVKRIRQVDSEVWIVVLSDDYDAAVSGYRLGVNDFLPDTGDYPEFVSAMKRCEIHISKQREVLILRTTDGICRIAANLVLYIEVANHKTTYHTIDGDFVVWGTLKEQEKILPSRFVRCNNCYVVNVKHILKVEGNVITMNTGDTIPISRSKKKEFMAILLNKKTTTDNVEL